MPVRANGSEHIRAYASKYTRPCAKSWKMAESARVRLGKKIRMCVHACMRTSVW